MNVHGFLSCCLIGLILSGCSSSGNGNAILDNLFVQNKQTVVDPNYSAAVARGATVYVLAIEAQKGIRGLFVHQTTNAKGEETWISANGLSLGVKDRMILATRGFGFDVLASDPSQSLALIRAGKEGVVERFVTLLNGDNQAETIVYKCRITRGKQWPHTLATGREIQTTAVSEACRNNAHEFENQYWVTLDRREIVLSRQWMNADLGRITFKPSAP